VHPFTPKRTSIRSWAEGTVPQVFEAERPQLVPSVPFDGFHATQASVSKTCLVRQLRQSGARLPDQIG
jgi:hypothetical protein